MKILSSFMAISFNGGDRISFTFDEVDEGGNVVSSNNKESFFVVDDDLRSHVEAIRGFIRDNKLTE